MSCNHRDLMNPFHDVSFELPKLFPGWDGFEGLLRSLRDQIKRFRHRLKLLGFGIANRLRESWAETEEIHRRMREAKDSHSQHFNLFYLR